MALKYTIKRGQSVFSPQLRLSKFLPNFRGNFGYRFLIDFTESCWFDESVLQEDAHDWNFKICGVTTAFEKNNVNAIIGAARPHLAKRNCWELNWYLNDSNAKWEFGNSPILVNLGEVGVVDIVRKKNTSTITVYKMYQDKGVWVTSDKISKETDLVKNAFRMIGPYFGGNRNAPQDMDLYVNMNKI
jgi:hypothetical protein